MFGIYILFTHKEEIRADMVELYC